MELAPAGIPLSFEVTFDSDLFVGMSVFDTTGDTPELVQGPDLMVNVMAGTYVGKFTGVDGRSYVIVKAVYTDEDLETLSPNYSMGSESIICQNVGGNSSGGGCAVTGLVASNDTIVGYVNC